MINYIIQIVAFQLLFLLVYDLFLKKETFFNWNRAYLIGTSILAIILPFIKIASFKEVIPKAYIIGLPEVVIGVPNTMNQIQFQEMSIGEPGFVWNLEHIFYIGVLLTFLLFAFKVYNILRLIYKNPKRWKGNILLVKLLNSTEAFSFLHYVFLGEKLKMEEQKAILEHELVHVQQKHTLDLLFFEFQRIVFWFNPLVYMYQKRLRTLHEYIVDKEALKTQSKSDYYQNLLTQVFETNNVSFINTFFNKSLIKKRITMLQKDNSRRIHLVKYLFLIPIVLGMLMYTSCYTQEQVIKKDKNQELTDNELKEQLYAEIVEEENRINEPNKFHFGKYTDLDKYIQSKAEYFKSQMHVKRMQERIAEISGSEGNPSRRTSEKLKRTYKEYLEWKETDKAKEIWENGSYDGVLRLVVGDMEDLTEIEKQKKKHKIDLLLKDEYFTKIVITDGKESFNMESTKGQENNLLEQDVIEVPFAVIENVPVYPGCEDLVSNSEKKKCMSEKITNFVINNFNTKIANQKNLTGRQRVNVIFKIDESGDVTGFRCRAPHPALEEEAIRVMSLLPKMKPGVEQGEVVTVLYSLPIIFDASVGRKE